ncbi:hypothetical protein ANANG_G00301430 [Anguilla anguilla]|uniref:Uncharacterized protein n=1 Tax=Anguilla anguilla TaxID=7936 RepID=A0A9D3LI43_ANGAN|nr:hypothetical protein ANANG_G00301430 [Anguilla anguilla]
MKPTILRLLCLALPLFFLSHVPAQGATNSSCSAESMLKETLDCISKNNLTDQEIASVMDSLKTATSVLEKRHKTVCAEAPPKSCRTPMAHSKGGLVCATVGDARYCKPMCNEGHDFAFLRRSRLFEECKAGNQSSWSTQYIGGNRLAVCDRATIQISGAKTAYFPKGQDCLKTKSQGNLEKEVTQTFLSELQSSGIQGNPRHVCLVCG